MPGRNLNDSERAADGIWANPPDAVASFQLKRIEISGGTGLRGIDGLAVPFRYPITAICGKNGVGKSTILSLAALAHHTPQNWYVHWGNPQKQRSAGDRSYYTFKDFFNNAHGETEADDVTVTWRFNDHGTEVTRTFNKKNSRWGTYASRPEREVDFLPLSRILPAHEISGVQSAFIKSGGPDRTDTLDPTSIASLSHVLMKNYESVELQHKGRYTFLKCQAGSEYTGFNMGGGESSVIWLLHLIQRMSLGGLLVVEEIEAGLHPEAQKRLAKVLVDTCVRKKIQIICSTHSEFFLDALPRKARLLLRHVGEEHEVFETPSTRFAMFEMAGVLTPELIIYCEDQCAELLILEALPAEILPRIQIKVIGSQTAVVRQGVAHIKSGYAIRALCVLDGDTTDAQVTMWLNSETGGDEELIPEYMILPGDELSPEKWCVAQLAEQVYLERFADQFDCSLQAAQDHVQALNVEIDEHNIGYCLHHRTNRDKIDCLRKTINSIAPDHPELNALRERVEAALE